MLGQVMTRYDRSGQVGSAHVRTNHVRSYRNQVRSKSDLVRRRSGQVKSRSGHVRSD